MGAASGDVALLVPAGNTRTLVRVPLGGGAPREVATGVLAADWARNGDFAVVREHAGRQQVEFPLGHVVYESPNDVRVVRVSPSGRHLALSENMRGYNVSALRIEDAAGAGVVTSTPWFEVTTVAWSPDGRFVWLTEPGRMDSGPCSGPFRSAASNASPTSPPTPSSSGTSGRTLASGGRYRYEMAGRPPGEAAERDLTWLGRSFVTDLSANGRAVLFEDGQFAKGRAFMFLRRTPRRRCSSPRPRRPGSRRTAGGRSASPAQSARQLAVIPTGAGQARALPRGSIDRYLDAFWFPDGRRVLIVAQERDRPPRLFEQDVGKGEPRPVTPEGVATSHPTLAPDGTAVLAGTFEPGGMFRLYPLNGGEPTSVPGLLGGDKPLRFDGTGRFVFVRQLLPLEEDRAVIVRVDTQTARREHWLELRPSDRIGVGAIWMVRLSADGRGYAYSYSRDVSNLFPVRGLP